MRLSRLLRSLPLVVALGALPGALPAAESAAPAKRPFAHTDFEAWRGITGQALSRDGRFLAYAYMPLEGDGEAIVREIATGRELRAPAGELPPVPVTGADTDPERAPPRRAVNVLLTSDSRFAVANTFPARADTLAAKRAGKPAAELPPEGLVIIDLASGIQARIAGVKNLQVPARGGAWLAYLRASGELVLRNLATAAERTFPGVTDYSFARDGKTLVFTVVSKNGPENGVFAVTPGDSAAPLVLATGAGRYRKFVWNRPQTAAVFLSDRDETSAATPRLAVYRWTRGTSLAARVLAADAAGIPTGWIVSPDAAPAFSSDDSKLFVATAPAPQAPDPRLATQLEEEKVRADLWRWNDDVIQPLQKVRADKERQRAYLGEIDLASGTFKQLADPTLATLTFNDDGSAAFGLDDRPYRRRVDYDGFYNDLYLVNAATGARQLVAKELGEKA